MHQGTLFDLPPALPANLPPGVAYEPDFLSPQEEAELLDHVAGLPFAAAKYKGYTARRRIVSYGGSFDYDANRLLPAAELIPELHALRNRVAQWLGVRAEALAHALVAEYGPGTALGWHRDVPEFEDVAGVSLASEARMRLRPWPPVRPVRANVVRLELAPRSIYAIRGPARWQWQHSVAPTRALRYSITFRTRSLHAAEDRPRR